MVKWKRALRVVLCITASHEFLVAAAAVAMQSTTKSKKNSTVTRQVPPHFYFWSHCIFVHTSTFGHCPGSKHVRSIQCWCPIEVPSQQGMQARLISCTADRGVPAHRICRPFGPSNTFAHPDHPHKTTPCDHLHKATITMGG
jgi:hypothetical protein